MIFTLTSKIIKTRQAQSPNVCNYLLSLLFFRLRGKSQKNINIIGFPEQVAILNYLEEYTYEKVAILWAGVHSIGGNSFGLRVHQPLALSFSTTASVNQSKTSSSTDPNSYSLSPLCPNFHPYLHTETKDDAWWEQVNQNIDGRIFGRFLRGRAGLGSGHRCPALFVSPRRGERRRRGAR